MEFCEFLHSEENRLESYIRRFARTFGISGEGLQDLRQEAHLAAFRALPYWRAGLGHKSAFNWCAGPMRRAMEKAVRREFGMRPSTSEPIQNRRADFDENRHSGRDAFEEAIRADIIDLKDALARDKNPLQIRRLLMSAFSPDSEQTLAKRCGIARQSLWASNAKSKARLLRRMA